MNNIKLKTFKSQTAQKISRMETSSKPCKHFASGNCKFGDDCRYLHTSRGTTPNHHQAPVRQSHQTPNYQNNQSLVLKQNQKLQNKVAMLEQKIDQQEKNELRKCINQQNKQIEGLMQVTYDTREKHDQEMKEITEKLHNQSLQAVAFQSGIQVQVNSGVKGFKALQDQVVSIQNRPKSPVKETHTVQVVGAPWLWRACTHSSSYICGTYCRWR